MKRIFFLLTLLLCSVISFSQSVVQRSSTAITEQDGRLSAQLNLYVPRYLDTVQASLTINIGIDTCGALIFTYSDNSYWMRVCAPTKHWVKLLKTGDVAATIWGTITGTLSSQTDLQNALNLKFNISDTTNKWVQNIYSRNDSLFKLKNGFESYLGRIGRDSVNNGLSTSGDKIQLGSNSTSGADLIHNTYINQQSKLFQIIDNGDVTFRSDPLNATYQLGKNNVNGSYISLDSASSQFNIVASNAHYINMNGIASEFKAIMQGGFAFLDLDAGNGTHKIGDISSFGSGNNTYLNVDDANAGFTFNTGGARKALLSNTGQWTWDGYPALTRQTDTTNIKPLGYNTTTGLIQPMANWSGNGSGSLPALTYKNIAFGGIGNVLSPGEIAFRYDSITNELSVDSINLLNVRINEDPYNKDSTIFYGTSITVGTGQSSGNRYSTLTANKLNSIEGNRGISGATLLIQGMANISTLPVWSRVKYRWIILEWGVNDIDVSGTDSTAFDTVYRKYIDTLIIARGWPASRIVILAPSYIDPTVRPTSTLAKQAQFRGATQSIATAKGTKWVDIYSAELFRNPANLLSDGIHPTDYGASIYVNSIYKTVADSVMSMAQNISVNGYTELQRLKLRNSDTANYKAIVIGLDSSGNIVRFTKDQIIQNSTTLLSPQGSSISLVGSAYFGNVTSPNTVEKVQVNGMIKGTSLRATGSSPSGLTGNGIELFMAGSVGGIIAYNRTGSSGLTLALNQLGGQVVVNATAASGGAEQFYVNGGSKSSFGQFISTLPGGMTGNGIELGRINSTLGYVGAYNRDASTADNLSINGLGGNILIGSFTDNTIGKLQVTGKATITTIDSTSTPLNMLYQEPSTGEIKKVAVLATATTLYTGDGTLAGNRSVSGGSNSLSFGTGGSPVSAFTVTSSGRTNLFSAIVYDVDANNTDADYTVASNTIIAEISDVLTTGRTLTLPTASINGQAITLLMRFSSGTKKYSLSAAVTDNATGSTFTTLDWGKTYDFMVDQSLAWRLIRKY